MIAESTYDADAIDELTIDCKPPSDDGDLDPAFVAVAQVVWGAARVLEEIRAAQASGPLGGVITQGYVDRLAAAFATGRRVLNHDDHERLEEDLGRADDDLLDALADDVVPVARHFGVEIDLPTPDDDAVGMGGDR